jgi:diguanylate cyclase (GGDEF)-like protein
MPRSKHSSTIRRTFFAVLLLYLGSSGLFLYSIWRESLNDSKRELLLSAETTSEVLQGSLEDSLLLLSLIKQNLGENNSLAQGLPPTTHALLKSTRKEFNLYHPIHQLGLTIVVDSTGKVIDWSGPLSGATADLSEKFFFKAIKADPSREYALSELMESKVSGTPVYQIAIPVRSSKGDLVCVLSQQIDAQTMDQDLQDQLSTGIKIVAQMSNGAVLFQHPLLPLPSEAKSGKDRPLIADKQLKTAQPSENSGQVFRIKGGSPGIADTSYVGVVQNGEYGINTVAMVSEKSLFSAFLRKNWGFLPLTLLGVMILAALFYSLCMMMMNLENALWSATTDPLTGIPNRRSFENDFSRLVRLMHRESQPLALLFIDIDHFKHINDEFGHPVGDRTLKEVAECIREEARRPFDLCCRWGGEEFVLALPKSTPDKALVIANRLRLCVEALTKSNPTVTRQPKVTISIGIANLTPGSTMSTDELVRLADEAMLQAKAEGRNRMVSA